MQNFTICGVYFRLTLTNIFDLSIQCKTNRHTHIEILIKMIINQSKSRYILFTKLYSLLYKHMFNHIAKRKDEFAPKSKILVAG